MINWHKVLNEINDKIQGNVLSVTHLRNTLPVQRFKALLDKQAQDAIIETLDKLKADVTLVSEEGDQVFGEGTYTMVADPVDGTTNLARGLSPAVASISVSETGYQSGVIAGIVSNFFTGETFYAEKGKGATLDKQEINVAPDIKYRHGMIGMDISKNPAMDRLGKLIGVSRHVRQEGCSAMSLCNVAAGILDAHIDLRGIVRATDISAGLFIIKEAGGVYMINGKRFEDMPLTRTTRVELIAACTPKLLDEIEEIMG
jgi:myo-inositol-1(or 4)-monophosphatase